MLNNVDHIKIYPDNTMGRTEIRVTTTNFQTHGTYLGIDVEEIDDNLDTVVDTILTPKEALDLAKALTDSVKLVESRVNENYPIKK